MNNKITQKIIPRKATVSLTADELRLNLNLSGSISHRIVRIYSDGTYYMHDADSRLIYENIAYNMIYRGDSSLIVDGIIVHLGFEKPKLMQKLNLLQEKGVEFSLPASILIA